MKFFYPDQKERRISSNSRQRCWGRRSASLRMNGVHGRFSGEDRAGYLGYIELEQARDSESGA